MTQKTAIETFDAWEVISETDGAKLYYTAPMDNPRFEAFEAVSDWTKQEENNYDSVSGLIKALDSQQELTDTGYAVRIFADEFLHYAESRPEHNDYMERFHNWAKHRTNEEPRLTESLGMSRVNSDEWYYQMAIVFDSLDESPFEGRRFIPIQEGDPGELLFGLWSKLVDTFGTSERRMATIREEFVPTYDGPVKVPVGVAGLGKEYVAAYLMVFMVVPGQERGSYDSRWWNHSKDLQKGIARRLDMDVEDVVQSIYKVKNNK